MWMLITTCAIASIIGPYLPKLGTVNKVKKTWMVKAVEGEQNAVMGVTAHLDPELIGNVQVWEKRDRLYFGD